MNRLCSLPILLLAAGCGTNLGAEQQARNDCPTLTDAEFELLWNAWIVGRDWGGTREETLSNIVQGCDDPEPFDRSSECRACLTAITEAVY